jgi:hypothetical protein
MTRGLPRKMAATITFDAPTPDEVWMLARRLHEIGDLFSVTARKLRSKRSGDRA